MYSLNLQMFFFCIDSFTISNVNPEVSNNITLGKTKLVANILKQYSTKTVFFNFFYLTLISVTVRHIFATSCSSEASSWNHHLPTLNLYQNLTQS
jgi:hypothetical protein